MDTRVHPNSATTPEVDKESNSEKDNLKIGDVVLVVDNNSPRGRWLLGRVIKTFPGRDGKVRVAEIKTKNSTLTRPISKLCLLEEAV